jgi:glucans biosynthesis protein
VSLLTGAQPIFTAEQQFGFADVVEMAKNLAGKPFEAPKPIAEPLRKLDYDAWRNIRFDTKKSLWRDEKLPFEVQFFPPGFLYDRNIGFNVIDGSRVTPMSVTTDMFDFSQTGGLKEKLPPDMGTAGFRVHGAINKASYLDEFLVFLGATYFRAVGKNQGYGLSARGLTVNTAEQSGEEFPWFREFWFRKPAKGDKSVTIYALMDSESLTGAYSFTATPGDETVIEVTSRIFLRKPVKSLGVAPLTSMFLYGENSDPGSRMDWRPEVHDSDGLLVHMRNGEWLWRPLRNPATLQVNAFEAGAVRGFGLMQRDTDFRDYQDLESAFERRPSLWIEPTSDWGQGVVKLVNIPSDKEVHDNVAAFWNPEQAPEPGKMLSFDYRMRWLTAPDKLPPGAMVTATRTSRPDPDSRMFIIDFSGGPPAGQSATTVQGVVDAAQGARVVDQQAYRNTVTGGWRLSFKVAVEARAALASMSLEKRSPIELRAYLKFGDGSVSETWSYAMTFEK